MSLKTLVALTLVGFTTTYAIPTATRIVATPTVTCPPTYAPPPKPTKVKDIIIDTDLLGFTDDAGAIALANIFHIRGYVKILGIVSDVTSQYSLPGISGLNTYYCNPNIQLAQTNKLTDTVRGPTLNVTNAEYITEISNPLFFPNNFDRSKVQDPLTFYTNTLKEAKKNNTKVTIVAIGFPTNLHDLYYSTGGPALINDTVEELVIQGGSCNTTNNPHSAGTNFVYDLPSAHVLTKWPSPVTYFPGFTAGQVSAGQTALKLPKADPLNYVYNKADFSFKFGPHDILTTYYAIFGIGEGSFQYGNKDDKGGLQFVADPKSAVAVTQDSVWNDTLIPPAPQHYLILNEAKGSNETIARNINDTLACVPMCS